MFDLSTSKVGLTLDLIATSRLHDSSKSIFSLTISFHFLVKRKEPVIEYTFLRIRLYHLPNPFFPNARIISSLSHIVLALVGLCIIITLAVTLNLRLITYFLLFVCRYFRRQHHLESVG